MSDPLDKARAWQRPIFSGVIAFAVIYLTLTLPEDDRLTALIAFLIAGGILYFVRGVVDKGQLTEWLRIWKGIPDE